MIHIGEVTLEQLLLDHQRADSRYCLCGWGLLGASHAAHLVTLIKEAEQP